MLNKIDFYNWAYHDLLMNNQRWILAEYIVAKALNIEKNKRIEWDAYDLIYKWLKIEIKSCSYIQSWEQKNFSYISFNIAKTQSFDYDENKRKWEKRRQSDAYILCLLKHKDKNTINPLDLSQWYFYIVETSFLNKKLNDQKTISLATLNRLWIQSIVFDDIKVTIDKLFDK